MAENYVDVLLRLALPGTLQFSVPEGLRGRLMAGQRVRVPLRAGFDVGYIVSFSDAPKVKGIKPIAELLDSEPFLPQDLLELLLWVADHNIAPPGLVIRSALPRAAHLAETGKATAREKTVSTYTLSVEPAELPLLLEELKRKAPLQARLLAGASSGPLDPRGLPSSCTGALRALVAKGHLREERQTLLRGLVLPGEEGASPPGLSPEQQRAFESIGPTLGSADPAVFLLHGVTGSGKSEIYARAVRELPGDRQAIILVPEVSLTAHLIGHFRQRLPFPIGLWHHQLSEGEKHDLWRALRRGQVRVVIGARSAVFAPFPSLGLVVVDEEHDGSYKQEEAPSYHARETAIQRARLSGATVILGSATPSLESYHCAEEGLYTLLSLPSRFSDLPLPAVETIDLKDEGQAFPPAPDGKRPRGRRPLLAPAMQSAAESALGEGSQVLFFLNRRGFAPFTHCGDCGWACKCPNCQVSLVFHSQDRSLICHYCGFRSAPAETCPSCRGTDLRLSGSGTQRIEEEIRRLFPGHSVARLDRDSASRKGAGGRVARDFADGRTDILVGTQMAAKGFHFPRLSFVGVLDPDISLNLPDFRAAEKTFQLVTQVAGRAGREGKAGKVAIQTFQPEHYALKAAAEHDFLDFYRREMEFRRELEYPPFCDLILLRTDGPDADGLDEATDRLAARLRDLLSVEVLCRRCHILGPVPAPLRKIRNRYRSLILIKSRPLETAAVHLRAAAPGLHSLMQRSRVHLAIDVNPLNLL